MNTWFVFTGSRSHSSQTTYDPETRTRFVYVIFLIMCLCVFSLCIMHAVLSLYPDLRQRHVAMATPGPVPRSPGGTPLRGAPGGPPEKGLAGSVASPTGASQAETPQQMMRRSMSPYSPGPGSGSVHSYSYINPCIDK